MTDRKKPKKLRLDVLLVERGWCDSRHQAQGLIRAGKVRQGTVVLDKPGKLYPEDIDLTQVQPPRFVSRGGDKLEGFLQHLPIAIEGRKALDVGASTGGFSDCLLQRGAAAVTCVDVGRQQLHPKLQGDARVQSFERMNARYLEADALPFSAYDIVVIDVSFISLSRILLPIWSLIQRNGVLIALIKPQFEAEKKAVDAGAGIIRDPEIHKAVIKRIRTFAELHLTGSKELKLLPSTVQGVSGNQEFFIAWTKTDA